MRYIGTYFWYTTIKNGKEKFVIFNPWILDSFRVRSENVMGYLLTHDSLGTMRKQPD